MNSEAVIFPARYVFNRSLRIPHFIRAFLITGVGALMLIVASVSPDQTVMGLLWWIGAFITFSGGLALVILCFVTLFDKEQVIDVDTKGFEATYANGHTETFSWDEVISYKVRAEYAMNTYYGESGSGESSISGALIGCLVGMLMNLYLIGLSRVVTGRTYTIHFKLEPKRDFSILGFGAPMYEIIDKVLPQVLPDKKTIGQ